jgi:hypothetical protein
MSGSYRAGRRAGKSDGVTGDLASVASFLPLHPPSCCWQAASAASTPFDRVVTPADVTRTVYHAMGVDDLEARDREGRPYSLLQEGSPILDLF